MQQTETSHRSRLLEGMAQAVSRKGYADATIADIVSAAGVSRRTFYEHFSSKGECLVALYEAASHEALKVLRDSIDPARGWQQQVTAALSAYLGCMASNPVLVRTLLIEILHLGTEGLASRRRVNGELAKFIADAANAPGRGHDKPVSSQLAMAVVGGINELILEYIELDKVSQLEELVSPARELLHAVLGD